MNYDELWPGGPCLIKGDHVFSLGTDAVMLASFASTAGVKSVCDLGCGSGIIALLIALGLWKAERAMIKGFTIFGWLVTAVITVGLASAIVESLTGIVVIPGMAPLSEGYATVGGIALILAGAFPLVYTVTKVFRKPLMKLGGLLGMNDVAAAGMVATLANSIPMFGMLKDMDKRGKVLNVAFAVSAAFVFGDHLGFAAGFAPQMLPAMILGKLAGGISAVAAALWLTRKD